MNSGRTEERDLRIAFAGDRDIGVWVLTWLVEQGVQPLALLLAGAEASHADELRNLCHFLAPDNVFRGAQFREPEGVGRLEELNLDFILGVHFPYIIPEEVLTLPRLGFLNLHPAYLPYNRGWHTPTWGLLDGTALGATLHFMDAGIDTGDIVHQRELIPSPGDTAHSVYQRLKLLEFEVFKEAWPGSVTGTYQRTPQSSDSGSVRRKRDLFRDEIQRVDLGETVVAESLIRRLRALTTSNINEAAYYEADGRRFRVQVIITEEPGTD